MEARRHRPLTQAQTDALSRWIEANGARTWKSALRKFWEHGLTTNRQQVILYCLRNTHGPRWLARYRHPVDL
jgi:hypothetical protein